MPRRQSSRGTCVFCKNDYTRSGMGRHLSACKARKAAIANEEASDSPKTGLFHLVVQGTHSPDHWMHLQVPVDATLHDLDQFLRDTWLECCGHLSMFQITGKNFMSQVFESWWGNEDQDMDFELSEVLAPGIKFAHEYDFGTSTYLAVRVLSEREGVASTDKLVQILARNHPLDYRCEVCGEPATRICGFCGYTLLCDECIETHECGEEGLLPVVNSPRMGMCGYTGGAW